MILFVQWKEYFHSVKDEHFHLSPHENILTIALINIHYLCSIPSEPHLEQYMDFRPMMWCPHCQLWRYYNAVAQKVILRFSSLIFVKYKASCIFLNFSGICLRDTSMMNFRQKTGISAVVRCFFNCYWLGLFYMSAWSTNM